LARSENPQTSFLDLVFRSNGIAMAEDLQLISEFLDAEPGLVELVHQDLVRDLKKPERGRKGITPRQTLRCFILQRIKNWSLRELRERIADGYTLRIFTSFFTALVPKHNAFFQAFSRLRQETVLAINELVLKAAIRMRLEKGEKLRADTTVTQTDIHFPTDATLLWDSVRTISRLVRDVGESHPELSEDFPNRSRRAKRRMREIQQASGRKKEQKRRGKYRDLLTITYEVVQRAGAVAERAKSIIPSLDFLEAALLENLRQEIEHYRGLAVRVMDQTRRRVLEGEKVPVSEKIFSIFEPHTDLIMRGKVRTPVEFGHKVLLSESGTGLITTYEVLQGNPSDEDHVAKCLQRHKELFGTAPDLFAADRGFYCYEATVQCQEAGVKIECLPQRGGKKTPQREAYEKSAKFKAGQRFRAGIEGRISVLFRGRGLKRCLLHGIERFDIFVGAGVLANNLLIIARLLREKGTDCLQRA
jgi:IS5 family transposase